MDDEEIVSLFWDRDQKAIYESKTKYGSLCRGIAYRILRDYEDALECENDTYLRAWCSIPDARPRMLGAFLSRIARNLSLDVLRKRHANKREHSSVSMEIEEFGECLPDAVDWIIQENESYLAECLDHFLGKLKPEARLFFVQRYLMSYSIKEIAQKNDVTQGKVKMSLARTRAALKEDLTERGLGHECQR